MRFTIFDKRNTPALEMHHISTLLVTRDGSLWTGATAVTRYKDRQFKSYSKRDGLNGFIWSLAEGPDGRILIATYSRGLCRFHESKFTSYTVSSRTAV